MAKINKEYFKKQHEEHNGISDERMEEIVKEVAETQKEDNAITDKIDREETKKETIQGLKSFDADLVYDTINSQATVFENIAAKFYQYEIDNIDSDHQSKYWNAAAKENEAHGKDLRKLMTHLVRMQKGNDRIKNINKQLGR